MPGRVWIGEPAIEAVGLQALHPEQLQDIIQRALPFVATLLLSYYIGLIVERREILSGEPTNLGDKLMYPARLVPRALRVYTLVAGFALLSGSGLAVGAVLKRALGV